MALAKNHELACKQLIMEYGSQGNKILSHANTVWGVDVLVQERVLFVMSCSVSIRSSAQHLAHKQRLRMTL